MRVMHAILWIIQLLLAAFSLAAGINHGLRPLDRAAQTAPWIADLPPVLVRIIGMAELAAGIGLVLPAATRILPSLTPQAALGLASIMLLAIPFHIYRGESDVIGLHIAVVTACAFVAWGRLSRMPIEPRGRSK